MNDTLIVLLGPTGVGKTELAVDLAKYFGCEIISADSRQFYRELQIGTAVPDQSHLDAIKHHFIRFLSVTEYYSASLFERDVLGLLPELFSQNSRVLMAGGSGLYIDAVCKGIDDIPDVDPLVRQKYMDKYQMEGLENLRMELKLKDPVHYSRIDLKNPKRILRALEVFETTGKPYSGLLTGLRRDRGFRILKVGLELPRDVLFERINARVDRMLNAGLESEVRSLTAYRALNPLNTVGYKELFEYLDGKITKEKATELIKRNTRRFARRQITWWARDKEIRWFRPEEKDSVIRYIEENT
jgi:tRNA dimethylallyltransferase